MDTTSLNYSAMLRNQIDHKKANAFVKDYEATDAEGLGLVVASISEHSLDDMFTIVQTALIHSKCDVGITDRFEQLCYWENCETVKLDDCQEIGKAIAELVSPETIIGAFAYACEDANHHNLCRKVVAFMKDNGIHHPYQDKL